MQLKQQQHRIENVMNEMKLKEMILAGRKMGED